MVKEIKEAIRLTAWIRNRWEQPSTLALVLLAIGVCGFSFSYHYDLPGIAEKITRLEALIVVSTMVLAVIGWFFSTRLPTIPSDRIGILVAIDCETKKERQRLKADFINALRDEMTRGNHQQYVVHELSEYRSRKIGSHEQAAPVLRQTGSHLMVYGRCKVRIHENRPTYVLELNASVRHSPIALEVSRQFSKDIDLAFPRKALIPETEEFRGFELAKDLVGLASRFILGIASLLSGNPVSAFDLHHGVWIELKKKGDEGIGWPHSRQLIDRVATVLVEDGLNAANLRFTKKPPDYLVDMGRYLDVVQEIDPSNYNAHLLKGIYIFMLSRDIESAKKEIKKAENSRDAAWLWSAAFLDAYDERLEVAHKTYQRAFRSSVADNTSLQVETFIADVLNLEPDKIQLWYCLGMINYFYKEDLESAKIDFSTFCEQAESAGKFQKSVEFGKKYLVELVNKTQKPN